MNTTLPYGEGSLFAVPLKQGGFATGVVARVSPPGMILLAYFFGPRNVNLPTIPDSSNLDPSAALKRLRIGDLGLINGSWPIVGTVDGWSRDKWPMPAFIRRHPLTGRAWRSTYRDADPSSLEFEEELFHDDHDLESDGMCGAGYVEAVLTKLLA